MRLLLISIAIIASIALSGCSGKKADEANSGREGEQKVAFSGPWETGLLSFTNGQCAFKLDLQNGTDFAINEFTTFCTNDGEYGLYAPLHFVKASVDQFTPEQMAGFTPPAGAKILALQNAKLEPRGWLDEAQKKFYFAVGLTDSDLFNRLSLTGQMDDAGQLTITKIEMREGFRVQDNIVFRQQADPASSVMWKKSAWNKLKLPSYAVPSTSASNRNYLYCAEAKNPNSLGLIDFVTKKYSLDFDHYIGEIGFINLNGENQVFMSRTDSGTVTTSNGFQKYYLSVTQVGGRNSTVGISIQADGYALLTWNWYTVNLCRFIQNDVFAGRYTGWNP